MRTTAFFAIALLFANGAMPQGMPAVDEALQLIENNNNEIKAAKALWKANTLQARSENVLGSTSVAYEKIFGVEDATAETGRVTVTQEFDFPSLYVVRSQAAKKQNEVSYLEYEETRRTLLLQAKEMCIDMIKLRLQNGLIAEKRANIEAMAASGEKRLAAGDIGMLDYNKLKMQLMEENAALAMNENEIERIARSLAAMNGGEVLQFDASGFGEMQQLPDFQTLCDEAVSGDVSLMRSKAERDAASASLRIEKNKWLPSFELSYIREMHINDADNGLEVGISLPLFSNARMVKKAKAYEVYSTIQASTMLDNVSSAFIQDYREAEKLAETLQSFDVGLVHGNIDMLKKALEARHISTIEYFTEINSLYGMLQTYYALRADYEKALARLYKHRL